MSSGDGETRDEKALTTALAYYDMALSLQKPYDPNYPTALNWKCNALIKLGRYADAVAWYREIIRISDETNGKHLRDAYAELAEKMIQAYAGRPDESLQEKPGDDGTTFDEPPYCMYAEAFCELLVAQKFKKAHDCLSPSLKKDLSLEKLRGDWLEMSQSRGARRGNSLAEQNDRLARAQSGRNRLVLLLHLDRISQRSHSHRRRPHAPARPLDHRPRIRPPLTALNNEDSGYQSPQRADSKITRQKMNCPRCTSEMEEGSCFTGQSGWGFLFVGFALPHLFFQAPGKKKLSVASWRNGAMRSFRCPTCASTVLHPNEPAT